MMASNIISKILPPAAGSPSIYETLQQFEDPDHGSNLLDRSGTMLDGEGLGDMPQDYELNNELNDVATSSNDKIKKVKNSKKTQSTHRHHPFRKLSRAPITVAENDEIDDEVPQSLLIEDDESPLVAPKEQSYKVSPVPIPGLATRDAAAKWQATQEQQRLHRETETRRDRRERPTPRNHGLGMIDPKEKAMWKWANVENLDNFLRDVYDYFLGNGFWSILLSRGLNLLTLAFVVGFSTFLSSCIEYRLVPSSKRMSQILIPHCAKRLSNSINLLIWLFVFLWICKLFQYLLDIGRLWQMHEFYRYLLEIPNSDIQTVSWQEIVKRLMLLRDSNPATAAGFSERHRHFMGSQSKQRMDAHDIANRLMRRENYLIALFNKDILDLTLPVPFFRNRQLFSKTLEWNLSLCILDYVFNDQGQVRPLFLRDTHRRALSNGLRRRFLFAGIMNVLCAPFIILYFLVLFFFRYFNEYQRNPSQIGFRQYTPLAEWKFREFNELWHLFQRRINMSYPFASRYINQFPKDKTVQISRFIAFVAGALASVLALASLIDPELFLGFEITPERTVLFYLGVLGTIWAVARGAVPEENLVFDPEYALTNVIEYTHYMPSYWRGRLHSDGVRADFAQLYQMKLVIFLEEILSIIFTPFILWFRLPSCSDRLVDFFREFTIHVDGLGHVCSFAVFNFKKDGNVPTQQRDGTNQEFRKDYYSTKDGKMLASYYGFIDNYVTNQRLGGPLLHSHSNKTFHPPPIFPGIASPSIVAETTTLNAGKPISAASQQRMRSRPGIGMEGHGNHSEQRTPRFNPTGRQSSPVTSILLDPEHQPSHPGQRTPHRPNNQSRIRASRKPLVDPVEDEEAMLLEEPHRSVGGVDVGLVDDNLGESWKTTRAGASDHDGGEDAQTTTHDQGPGVLGLVYQFSKARTEGRGTTVNI